MVGPPSQLLTAPGMQVNSEVEATERNQDFCMVCKDGGTLVCCDGCEKAVHAACMGCDNTPEVLPPGCCQVPDVEALLYPAHCDNPAHLQSLV